MICIYDAAATDFTGHGLGILHPTACTITEEADGAYELSASLPVTEAREDELLALDRMIKAPGAPKREAEADQLFRITELQEAEDGGSVAVKAQHISYDLTYDVVGNVDSVLFTEATAANQISSAITAALVGGGRGVTVDCRATSKIQGDWRLHNGSNAFLDQQSGLVRLARARLIRDNRRMLILPEDTPESGAVIRYGGELIGFSRKRACDQVYTRLIPIGETARGAPLSLPEGHIDSPRIGDYSAPRLYSWKVSGAKVGGKNQAGKTLTEADVIAMLRDAAQEQLRAGCDVPNEELEAGYLDMSRTEEYELTGAMTVCLYDAVTLVPLCGGPGAHTTVSGYTWDALTLRYTGLKFGDVYADRTANVVVTAPQMGRTRRTIGKMNEDISLLGDTVSIQGTLIELKADATITDGLSTRINHAEIALDGLTAKIELKANQDALNDLEHRVSAAEISIDGANAAITLKADQTAVDALGTRVSLAEVNIDGAKAQIDLKVSRDGVISAINISPEEISINAEKINLNGYVTATQLNATKAEIDNLRTGKTKADHLSASAVTAAAFTFAGYKCKWLYLPDGSGTNRWFIVRDT